MPRPVLFTTSAIAAGLLLGLTIWLWHVHGASVFIAMTESLLVWCL